MNTRLKNLLLFVLGIGLGAGGSYQFFKTKYQTLADEEIESVKNAYAKKLDELYELHGIPADESEEPEETVVITEEDVVEYEKLSRDYTAYGASNRKPLSELMKERGLTPLADETRLIPKVVFIDDENAPEDDEPEEDEEEFETKPIKDIPSSKAIRVITVDEFNEEDTDSYDKITLTYYDDGVVTDERDEVVPSPEDVIGVGTLERFGEGSEDPNVVYVRNEKTSTLFEIIKVEESYFESVLGGVVVPELPKKESKSKPQTTTKKKLKVVKDGDI